MRRRLLSLPAPAPLLALLGRGAWLRALHELSDALQSPAALRTLGYYAIEAALLAVFPEARGVVEGYYAAGAPPPLA